MPTTFRHFARYSGSLLQFRPSSDLLATLAPALQLCVSAQDDPYCIFSLRLQTLRPMDDCERRGQLFLAEKCQKKRDGSPVPLRAPRHAYQRPLSALIPGQIWLRVPDLIQIDIDSFITPVRRKQEAT
jgi:hypothetical protein